MVSKPHKQSRPKYDSDDYGSGEKKTFKVKEKYKNWAYEAILDEEMDEVDAD